MIRRTRPILTACVMLLVVLLGACGTDSKVGSKDLTDFESAKGEGALGGTTTTTPPVTPPPTQAPPPTTAAPRVTTATTAKPAATTSPPTTAAASITIKIQGDGQGNAFEPSNSRVFAGSIVRFQNVDNKSHQVKARNGEFSSPNLPPGGTWDFKATLPPGQYEYTDLARPYAVGYLEVLAR